MDHIDVCSHSAGTCRGHQTHVSLFLAEGGCVVLTFFVSTVVDHAIDDTNLYESLSTGVLIADSENGQETSKV